MDVPPAMQMVVDRVLAIVSTRGVRVLTLPGAGIPCPAQLPRRAASCAPPRPRPGARLGSAPASRGVGPSDRRRHQAVAAIIAPLSVHSAGGGRNARRPRGRGRLGHPRPEARVRGHAAADDEHRARRASSAAASSLATSWSTTASWNDAATSAHRRVGVAPDVVHHRGLQPGEREVELAGHRPREAHRRRVALARPAGRSPDRPGTRGRGGGRPCRTPRRRRRRRSGRRPGSGRGPP